jgi:small subunit ribosomal protein S10
MTDQAPTASQEAKKARTPRKTAKKAEAKLRITVRAYESKVLDLSVKQIVAVAERHGATVKGPIPLPTEIRKYTVNRGAFIDKDSRDQFERRTHKRLVEIVTPSQEVISSLTNIDLPSGVSIQVKMV